MYRIFILLTAFIFFPVANTALDMATKKIINTAFASERMGLQQFIKRVCDKNGIEVYFYTELDGLFVSMNPDVHSFNTLKSVLRRYTNHAIITTNHTLPKIYISSLKQGIQTDTPTDSTISIVKNSSEQTHSEENKMDAVTEAKAYALEALQDYGLSNIELHDTLLQGLECEDEELVVDAIDLLGETEDHEAIPALTNKLYPGNPQEVRISAIEALAEIGDKSAIKDLELFLIIEEDEECLEAIKEALEELKAI